MSSTPYTSFGAGKQMSSGGLGHGRGAACSPRLPRGGGESPATGHVSHRQTCSQIMRHAVVSDLAAQPQGGR